MITEDLSVFLADFGVQCSAGGHTFVALQNKPDQLTGFEEADQITKAHTITAPTVDIQAAGLVSGGTVLVGGTPFRIRYPLEGGDGAFTRLLLAPN